MSCFLLLSGHSRDSGSFSPSSSFPASSSASLELSPSSPSSPLLLSELCSSACRREQRGGGSAQTGAAAAGTLTRTAWKRQEALEEEFSLPAAAGSRSQPPLRSSAVGRWTAHLQRPLQAPPRLAFDWHLRTEVREPLVTNRVRGWKHKNL